MANWMSSLDESGCAPGVNLIEMGPPEPELQHRRLRRRLRRLLLLRAHPLKRRPSTQPLMNHGIRFGAALCCSRPPPRPAADRAAPPPRDSGGAEAAVETCRSSGDTPEFVQHVGCPPTSRPWPPRPIDATLPGARSVKVVLDHADGDALYFQNSVLYKIHYEFVSTHLSGGELPLVPQLSEFNTTEYFTPERRFVLGAVTHYDGSGRVGAGALAL
jgi:hypothetical protein